MEYQIIKSKNPNCNHCYTQEIVYNGVIFGTWDDNANVDYPEDLTLERDLKQLIDIGIEIGKQIEKDNLKLSNKKINDGIQ